jgi:hypothetical protein
MPELFANFEVNKDPRWPILLRLTGGSIFLHLLLLWLVVYIPAFRDALNIAALLANTRFVEKAYTATQIGDEVTLLDLNKEKFQYPEGYFAIENQQLGSAYAANGGPDPYAPKIISRASKDVEPEASPSPSPLPSPSPSALPGTAAAATNATPGDERKLTPEEAQTKLEQTAKDNNLELPDETQLNKQVRKTSQSMQTI